jgi:hypothetical protein
VSKPGSLCNDFTLNWLVLKNYHKYKDLLDKLLRSPF